MREKKEMATTWCTSGGCILSFNTRYVLAPRVADSTMLHEMCHMKLWDEENTKGQQIYHGAVWQKCMLQLDAQGVFREIIIDNYKEGR
jgi:predicted SprT family Zn-dependent metalloprotease